jgi:copper(I)-binding protein
MVRILAILRSIAGLVALTVIATAGHAHEFKAGDLTIDHPWTRATPAGAKTAAGYLKITNHGQAADTLLGGTAEGAEKLELHEMSVQNNIMKMRQLDAGLEIGPGETVELKPGSYHIMMVALKQPLQAGQSVKGALKFEKAGTVEVSFKVEPLGAKMDQAKNAGDGSEHEMKGHDGEMQSGGMDHKGHQ